MYIVQTSQNKIRNISPEHPRVPALIVIDYPEMPYRRFIRDSFSHYAVEDPCQTELSVSVRGELSNTTAQPSK
jgi:hypothetical protein